MTKTAIIIPTWNNSDLTINCFKSLVDNIPIETVIFWFDNGSEKSEFDKVEQYLETIRGKLQIMSLQVDKNFGFVKAVNFCWKKAADMGFDQVVLLNNDTEVPKGWLKRLEAGLKDGYGIVGAVSSKSDIGWQAVNNLVKNWEFFNVDVVNDYKKQDKILNEKFKSAIYPVSQMVAFFCTLITKEVWQKIGFLSEDYGIGLGDDDDYCLRARHAGIKIGLALGLCIYHHHRATFKILQEKTGFDYQEEQKKNIALFRRKYEPKQGR